MKKVAPSVEQPQQAVTESEGAPGPHVTTVAVPSTEGVAPPPPPSGVATACEEGSSASSPDVTEISRQAPIRQPFRKRRFNPM